MLERLGLDFTQNRQVKAQEVFSFTIHPENKERVA